MTHHVAFPEPRAQPHFQHIPNAFPEEIRHHKPKPLHKDPMMNILRPSACTCPDLSI
jgi:hypothetical protein